MNRLLRFSLLFAAACAAAQTSSLSFRFKPFDVPGALESSALGVNNAGIAVGYYIDQAHAKHGYIAQGGMVTTLDDPSGSDTLCYNLNDLAVFAVVGQYTTSAGSPMGFLYENGRFSDVPGPDGATGSAAVSINDSGDIVGYYSDSSGLAHGFLLHGGAYTTLDVPGGTLTVATSINAHGTVVLYWLDSSSFFESSEYDGQAYTTINVPGALNSFAVDLNNNGDVLYRWTDTGLHNHGAVLHAGEFSTFDLPNSSFPYPAGINDQQVIVGGFKTSPSGGTRGFKAAYR